MCISVTSHTFQGHYLNILIQPGGQNVAPLETPRVLDVRHFFKTDHGSPALSGDSIAALTALRRAVDQLWAKLNDERPMRPGQATPELVIVQCEKGCSRSPRCVGAFLMTYCALTAERALEALRIAYQSPTDDCGQRLSVELVRNWLEEYERSGQSKLKRQ